jgi:uncharacterized protein (DUF885 family)
VPFRWSRKHKPATAGTPADAALAQLLAGFADEILQLTPTTASSLGLDKGERAALKGKLEDASPAGDAAWAAQVHSMLQRLNAIDRNALGADAQVRYDTVRYAASEGEAGIRFSFGGAASGFFGGTAPYPVTQQDGAIVRIPEFLDSQHQIASAADAEAYLERVAALASVLDQETARIKQQASQGIMPPNYIARTALGQLQDYRKTRAAEQKLVTSLTERTAKLGLAGNWQQRARSWWKAPSIRHWTARSRPSAKPPRMPQPRPACTVCQTAPPITSGHSNWGLRPSRVRAKSTPSACSRIREIQARIDAILKSQGMTQGRWAPACRRWPRIRRASTPTMTQAAPS